MDTLDNKTYKNLRLSIAGDSFVLSSVMDNIPHGWGSKSYWYVLARPTE